MGHIELKTWQHAAWLSEDSGTNTFSLAFPIPTSFLQDWSPQPHSHYSLCYTFMSPLTLILVSLLQQKVLVVS